MRQFSPSEFINFAKISPTQRDKATSAFDFILFNTTTIVPLVRATNVSSLVNLQFNNVSHSHQVYPRFVTETDTYTLLYNLSGKKINLTETISILHYYYINLSEIPDKIINFFEHKYADHIYNSSHLPFIKETGILYKTRGNYSMDG